MNFNLTDYARLDAYDLQQLQITGSYEKHTRHWQLHLVADNEQLSLAGLPYQQNRALGGRLGWRWQRLHQFYTDMLLRQSEALDSQYEHLQGEQRQLQLGWLLTRPSHRLELALRLNREHRVGDTYGVNHFDSYSPLTRSLWMALDYHFSRRWQLFNQFELAYSRYLENDLINGHPVRGEVVALDWVSQLQFRLSRRFRLLMEYAWHDNLSPQLRRRYQNRVSLLGLQWQY